MNKRLAASLTLGMTSLMLSLFPVQAAESPASPDKAKLIEPVAKPMIAKPSDALASKSKDGKQQESKQSEGRQPDGKQPESKSQSTPTAATPSPPVLNSSPNGAAATPAGMMQTPSGRAINDLKVMPGALSAPKAAPSQSSPSAQTPSLDPLEDKVRVLLQDKLGKDGEVVLRVSPDTPLAKSESPNTAKARAATSKTSESPKGGEDTTILKTGSDVAKPSGAQGPGVIGQHKPWDWSGPLGPQAWSRLDPAYASCSNGNSQSPPLIAEQQMISSTGPALPQLSWQPQGFRWTRQGPLWTAVLNSGSRSVFRGESFDLESIQFRFPGEPFVGKKAPPGAVHLIHRQGSRVLIIAVPIEIDDMASRNTVFATLVRRFPFDSSETLSWTGLQIDPGLLLPNPMSSAVLFAGSLSYPPCTESILWLITNGSIKLPRTQLNEVSKLLGEGGRPLQPLNGRPVLAIGSAKP